MPPAVSCCLILVFVTFVGGVFGELVGDDQRPLEHEDYDRWNTIVHLAISPDGGWIMYGLLDGKQDVTLKIRSTNSPKEYSIPGGSESQFSHDGRFVVARIKLDQATIKQLKREKKKEDEFPPDRLEILDLFTGSTVSLAGLDSFQLPQENGETIAVLLKAFVLTETIKSADSEVSETFEVTPEGLKRQRASENEKKIESGKINQQTAPSSQIESSASQATKTGKQPAANQQSKTESQSAETAEPKEKELGTTLVVRNLISGRERRIPWVVNFRFDRKGTMLAYSTSTPNADADGVYVIDLATENTTELIRGTGHYDRLAFDHRGLQLAFISDKDDYQTKHPAWSLYYWKRGQSTSRKIAGEGSKGIPDGWWLSSSASPFFDESNEMLYYYTSPKILPDDPDQGPAEESVKLDVWHWQDPLLQPQQLLAAEQEKKRSYLASYNLRTRKLVQLANKLIPEVSVDPKRDHDRALATSEEEYKKLISWEMPGFRDVYLIDVKTGQTKLVLNRTRSQPDLSPNGKYLVWWDFEKRAWYSTPTNDPQAAVEVSRGIPHPLFDEKHDTPSEPYPYGLAGWRADDKAFWVYDRFDIWELDASGTLEPRSVTGGQGRRNNLRFRYRQLDSQARTIDDEPVTWLNAFDEVTRDTGIYQLQMKKRDRFTDAENEPSEKAESHLKNMLTLPEDIANLQKARLADRLIFTRGSFRRFPDIWTTDQKFETIQRISRANPQQNEYRWGSVELVSWPAADGQKIEGLLYKPDNFDPQTKYPLLVYFYERNADNLHVHYVPAAGRSIINFSFYTSRGYLIFVPDIPYKKGEPGPSAANAVLPGIEYLIRQGFVDPKRIGVQGHSWGGYQAAYLITQTDRFACAEAGAPVSNMTSAYGGIRWESGMSRMFQYERSQSRIGDTLWNAREKYIANSPLFFVDKIDTPLLILHNDQDGAVPWYQGIELFVALRRLEKPAWLLNYNNNPHWVMGEENRRDFARRLQQFFDHYLKDGPLPQWMATGIPAVEKGRNYGFEKFEPPKSSD